MPSCRKSSSKESKLLDSVVRPPLGSVLEVVADLNEISRQALLLIDEVHLLREKRGSVLEVVVARMKTINPDIRLCALSATVPNVDDVGKWLRPTNANESDWRKEDGSIDLEEMGSAKVFMVSSSLDHLTRAVLD